MVGGVVGVARRFLIGAGALAFAIVGPLAAAFGADATLIGAGLLGAVVTIAFMYDRGARDPERDGRLAEPIHEPSVHPT
jgi:hypothetical protein